jgi:hypothetical protein
MRTRLCNSAGYGSGVTPTTPTPTRSALPVGLGRCSFGSVERKELVLFDISGSYWMSWSDWGAVPSIGFLTSDPFPPDTNVYTTISLSQHAVRDPAVRAGHGGNAWAFIYEWTVHRPDGEVDIVSPEEWHNAEFIDNVHTVTYVLVVYGGDAEAQINIFTR